MTYFTPFIDASGFNIPTYIDIRDALIDEAKSIFGSDIYVENDSLDYQYISIFALKMYDTLQAAQLAYNQRGPSTAIGSGLDVVVKSNGLSRREASYSTCEVTLTGTAGTIILNGVVLDINGYKWDLPASVTIPEGDTITVTAICQTIGAISAQVDTLTTISTPTYGWLSVTNDTSANLGVIQETDAELRARQAISTELPSQTILSGTIAAIAALDGVIRYKVFENYTSSEDLVTHIPSHSISAIVQGGDEDEIAEVIYLNKGPGCGTYGDETVTVTDSVYNTEVDINFYRPTYVPIYVEMTIKKLTGWTTETEAAILDVVVDYLNSLDIGEDVTISALYGAALSVMTTLNSPIFSIQALSAAKVLSPTETIDIDLAFNEVSEGIADNIIITLV